MQTNKQEKYHISLRIVHWLMAACIVGLIIIGSYMVDLDKSDPYKYYFYGLHKSFGLLVLILFAIRVVLRFATKIPPLPNSINANERKAAHIVHIILYISMFAVPLSGYIMSNMGGYSVKFFGIKLPDLLATNKDIAHLFHEFHETAPYLMLAFIALHIAGALKHRFFDSAENDIIKRMI